MFPHPHRWARSGISGVFMAEIVSEVTGVRTPPQAIEVEQAVLGAMMLEKEAIAKAIEKIDESYFYRDSHRLIYLALVELFDNHQAADLYTITEALKKKGILEEAGGPYYLAELANAAGEDHSSTDALLEEIKKM